MENYLSTRQERVTRPPNNLQRAAKNQTADSTNDLHWMLTGEPCSH